MSDLPRTSRALGRSVQRVGAREWQWPHVKCRCHINEPLTLPARYRSKGCCFNAKSSSIPCFFPGGNAVPIKYVHVVQASHFDAGARLPPPR